MTDCLFRVAENEDSGLRSHSFSFRTAIFRRVELVGKFGAKCRPGRSARTDSCPENTTDSPSAARPPRLEVVQQPRQYPAANSEDFHFRTEISFELGRSELCGIKNTPSRSTATPKFPKLKSNSNLWHQRLISLTLINKRNFKMKKLI